MSVGTLRPFGRFETRLVACDLDGTLLDPAGSVRPAVREAVAAVRAAGVRVVIATGRSGWAAAAAARTLGLPGNQIVMNGGAYMSPATGHVVWARRLSGAIVREALALADGLGSVPLLGFTGTHVCARAGSGVPALPDFVTDSHLRRVDRLEDYADAGPVRVYLPTSPSEHRRAVGDAREWFGERASIVFGDEFGFEVMAPSTNKGEALRAVAESMGLDRCQVGAMGDAPNDREMLAYAGTSAALLPAPGAARVRVPGAPAEATIVVPSSDQDGAIDALRCMFPNLETLWPQLSGPVGRPVAVPSMEESAA